MADFLDGVRTYAQNHPLSVASGLIVVLPGAYLLVTGRVPGSLDGLCYDAPSPSHSAPAGLQRALSSVESNLPVAKWNDRSAPENLLRLLQCTKSNAHYLITTTGARLRLDVKSLNRTLEGRWTPHFPLSRAVSVAVTTALPGAFLVFVRNHPNSWAARHQTKVANALHVLALATVANQVVSVQDVLVTALVMVSFEALQRSVGQGHSGDHQANVENSAIETLLSSTHATVAKSNIAVPKRLHGNKCEVEGREESVAASEEEESEEVKEIRCLRKKLSDIETISDNKGADLKRLQDDLGKSQEALAKSRKDNTSLREEMKAVKQTIGRDHQAVIYRKDIELFALRKGNEQKEAQIKELSSMSADLHRQHEAAINFKDAQVRSLKDRLASYADLEDFDVDDGETSPSDSHHEHAMRVKILRIKGRSSQEHDRLIEEKDIEIAHLREDVSALLSGQTSETLTRVQDELRRAWNTTHDMQRELNEEKLLHAATTRKLQEAILRLDEEIRKGNERMSPTRLPTIEEQDKAELEKIFNQVQAENVRLHSALEAAEKKEREVERHVSEFEKETEELKRQLKVEKEINEDMNGARPSVVHRAHFQRMEGQLQEARDALKAENVEVEKAKATAAKKDAEISATKQEAERAARTNSQLQEEVEGLKRSVSELESTKEQLMLDHERLAQHRARQRTSTGTAQSSDYTSARSSGATLITEPVHVFTDETPLPPRPVTIATPSSVVSTPDRASAAGAGVAVDTPVTPTPVSRKSTANVKEGGTTPTKITNDPPPAELRASRRKSLNIKGLMRRMTRREVDVKPDDEGRKGPVANKEINIRQRPRTALIPKDKNAPVRPKTSTAGETGKTAPLRPKSSAAGQPVSKTAFDKEIAVPPLPALTATKPTANAIGTEAMRPATSAAPPRDKENGKMERPKTARYYTDNRPQSAIAPSKENAEAKERPKSRGWGGSMSRRLQRRSMA